MRYCQEGNLLKKRRRISSSFGGRIKHLLGGWEDRHSGWRERISYEISNHLASSSSTFCISFSLGGLIPSPWIVLASASTFSLGSPD